MSVRVLDPDDVRRLLPMDECIEVIDAAFRALGRGEVVLPLRQIMWTPDGSGAMGTMPAYLDGMLALKAITVFPGNHAIGRDSHQGVVLLFDGTTGDVLAAADAGEITAIRTAAASGVATRVLAREDAGDLAILGSGVQARSHLDAMLAVRDIRRVRVWSRTRANAERFASSAPVEVGVAGSAEDAVRDADIICTVTGATEPVLRSELVADGAHVNAVGFVSTSGRELDAALVARSRFIGDRVESVLNESGDFLLAREEGAVTDDHIAGELADVLLGRVAGRTSPDEVTVYESLGIAVQDAAAVLHVWRKAAAPSV